MIKKLLNITRIFILLLLISRLLSCTDQTEFEIPPLVIEEPVIEGEIVEIKSLLSSLEQEVNLGNSALTFSDSSWYLQAYVISDDAAGNFFEELYVQSTPANPNAGLRILIDDSPLYISYEKGRKIYIKLNNLSLGIENGIPTLGILENNRINKISQFLKEEIIIRSSKVGLIEPKTIQIEDFDKNPLCTFIQLENVQFNRKQVRSDHIFTYAAEARDEFNGERILEHCESDKKTIVSSSTFSDFKALTLPTKKGSVIGILTRNFFGEVYNIKINTPTDLHLSDENRCDPDVLICPDSSVAKNVLYEENFTKKSIDSLLKEGWLNRNIKDGKLAYDTGSFSGNSYLEISGFNSKETDFEVWAVTPEINLEGTTNAYIILDIQASFDNGNILTPYITTQFTGDITTTQWTLLDAVIPDGNPEGFGTFESVGPISISCLTGKIQIAFVYKGSDPEATTRYHIDNLKVLVD
ncbi:DUF5689 domain-containing protein [Aquimarina sp. ERC-38]|uniref:DUF5689 domain-containing protein n=1 Tax=Aquimarina sp. ERC-38 TaxID=2949996 RepID=UPI0022458571|nr:DUF5689 domain-containing protein [Aquimarina sp. ERC-38]UZO81815.1 DUF5689 domain-containing protein [Aquimarina sp. ERC-38]